MRELSTDHCLLVHCSLETGKDAVAVANLGDQVWATTFRPEQVHPTVFIAPGAVLVGDVTLGQDVGVWFNATLRGDTTPVIVGDSSNIQEGCILHADPGYPCLIGRGVTVGHGAVIHGARIGDNSLIGIRAVLLNGASVGENCLVGAGALLTEGKIYPPGSLILGAPAKVVRSLTGEEIESIRGSAARYVQRARAFKATQEDRTSMETRPAFYA